MNKLRRRVSTVATIPLVPVAALSAAGAAQIEIGVVGRWHACALLHCLAEYRSFLVQHGPDQWVVHAQTPGCHGESTEAAVAAIEEGLAERGIAEISIRVDPSPQRSHATAGSRS
jgi:hypothetical protein